MKKIVIMLCTNYRRATLKFYIPPLGIKYNSRSFRPAKGKGRSKTAMAASYNGNIEVRSNHIIV